MNGRLPQSFYLNEDVVQVAKNLLGKVLVSNINKKLTSGIIVETEAYSWMERGCHAYQNRKTLRNTPMFDAGGVSYVYLCYGVYELFNVVTNKQDVAEAVLIRALEPLDGMDVMMKRTKAKSISRLTAGPGKLTRALGITRKHNHLDLVVNETTWIEDRKIRFEPKEIEASARIGLNFKSPDALLPWRFTVKHNKWISK